MAWQWRHGLMYLFAFAGWYPHYLYLKTLSKKIHQIYLLRGGKYCRLVLNELGGERISTWITINDMHLLTSDMKRFDDTYDFLTSEGQMKHEIGVEMDYLLYHGTPVNNEIIYFLKEGTVHQPELFDNVVKGYNIDDTDFEINTEDNTRWLEPTKNY